MPFNGLAAQQLECLDYRRPPRDAGWQSPLLRRVLLRASISAGAARLTPGSPGVRRSVRAPQAHIREQLRSDGLCEPGNVRPHRVPARGRWRRERMPRGGVMSGCSWSGCFVCPRSLRNSTNRISKQRELSRTLAGIHTSSPRWSCSLRTTNLQRGVCGLVNLRSTQRVTAGGCSARRRVEACVNRHVILQWGTYSGGGKGDEAGDRRAPGAVPAAVSVRGARR